MSYYEWIDKVKSRLTLSSGNTAYNSACEDACIEASRYIDEKIRPYMTVRKSVTLSSVSYVSCIGSDIGKQVLDDEIVIGELLSYNNTTRIWKIKTVSSIAESSELSIYDGEGSGLSFAISTEDVVEAAEPFVFAQLPLTQGKIHGQIKIICADLAAGIALRRKEPQDMDTDTSGWWQQGRYKLDDFIKANWFKKKVVF